MEFHKTYKLSSFVCIPEEIFKFARPQKNLTRMALIFYFSMNLTDYFFPKKFINFDISPII